MKKIVLSIEQLDQLILVVINCLENKDLKDAEILIKKSLQITEIPKEEVLLISSPAKSVEAAISQYYDTDYKQEEKAAQRRGIDLCQRQDELSSFWIETISDDSFEAKYAVRRMAEILFGEERVYEAIEEVIDATRA